MSQLSSSLWVTCATGLLACSLPVSATPFTSDNFNDNSIDPALWSIVQSGTGPNIVEQNGRVEVSIPANTQGGDFQAGYIGNLPLTGDFDAQMDFSLLTWPSNNGIRVGIGLDVASAVVERTSFSLGDFGPAGDYYFTHFWDGPQGFVATSDLSGKLRVTRSGNIFSGYYWNGQDWTLIHQGPGTTETAHFAAVAWGHSSTFAGQAVQVAFDNFQLTTPGGGEPGTVPDNTSTFAGCALVIGSLLLVRKKSVLAR